MQPTELSDAERAVWEAFPRGISVDLRSAPDRSVRAGVVRSLLLGARDADPGHLAGLRLMGAQVTGSLELAYADVACPIRLEACHFDSPVDLYGARTRQVSLSESAFPGISASTATIDGNLRLNRCRSTGQVRLVGARITGTLILNGASLTGAEVAFQATRLNVGNDILARDGFVCAGELNLVDADIAGALRFEGAHLSGATGRALSAMDISVGGVANFCEGFRADGSMRFANATIKSHLCFQRACLSNPGGSALSCRHMTTGGLVLLPAGPINGEVDLRHARIGLLRDDSSTWPTSIQLDGLTYDQLAQPGTATERLRWLRLDPDGYLPQAYEQLAGMYRRLGRESDARDVLLAKHRRHRESLPLVSKAWGYLQDATVGYGYRPTRAAIWLMAILTLGTAVFSLRPPEPIIETHPPDYNAFVYALDLLLPIIDLGQQDAYNPHGPQAWLTYVLIASGWILATTIAAAATRTLRRDY